MRGLKALFHVENDAYIAGGRAYHFHSRICVRPAMSGHVANDWSEEERSDFEDMTDQEVHEAYFAAVEHSREITASWWRKFGDRPEENFDPRRHHIPREGRDEWERRLLNY